MSLIDCHTADHDAEIYRLQNMAVLLPIRWSFQRFMRLFMSSAKHWNERYLAIQFYQHLSREI